jgi:hypothetical protein
MPAAAISTSIETVAVTAATARSGAVVTSSSAMFDGSSATTQARWTRVSTAVEMPRKRCTSMTLSMPNARLRPRMRLGTTAAHTSAVRAQNPVTIDNRSQSGAGGDMASHSNAGPAMTAPNAATQAVRTRRYRRAWASTGAPTVTVLMRQTLGAGFHDGLRT